MGFYSTNFFKYSKTKISFSTAPVFTYQYFFTPSQSPQKFELVAVISSKRRSIERLVFFYFMKSVILSCARTIIQRVFQPIRLVFLSRQIGFLHLQNVNIKNIRLDLSKSLSRFGHATLTQGFFDNRLVCNLLRILNFRSATNH